MTRGELMSWYTAVIPDWTLAVLPGVVPVYGNDAAILGRCTRLTRDWRNRGNYNAPLQNPHFARNLANDRRRSDRPPC